MTTSVSFKLSRRDLSMGLDSYRVILITHDIHVLHIVLTYRTGIIWREMCSPEVSSEYLPGNCSLPFQCWTLAHQPQPLFRKGRIRDIFH
jgi:hypothetical protein